MRVIAGRARGSSLRAPRGQSIRPTSDRLREAVFSSLGERIIGAAVWDACAGTGAVAIEALSRGAASAVLSDESRTAIRVIRTNLEATRLDQVAEVLGTSWQRAIDRLAKEGQLFDLVYFDPPYADADEERFLTRVGDVLADAGLVLLEHPSTRTVPTPVGFAVVNRLEAGDSGVTFIRYGANLDEPMKLSPATPAR